MKLKLAASLCLTVATALAQTSGAHFQSATENVADNGAFVLTFTEAGLGNANVAYTLTADATAVYACFNGGGKHPAATNKVGPTALDSGTVSFASKNGKVTASITLGPPENTNLSCPTGQTLVLACVNYTDVTLTDTTNSVVLPDNILRGTNSRTFVSGKGISCA